MSKNMKQIEVSQELYDSITQLKKVFEDMTGEKIKSDEEVIGILISGFIESLNANDKHSECGENCTCKDKKDQ